MDRACSRKRWISSNVFALLVAALWAAWPRAALAGGEVTIIPSAEGHIGAWLALGPIAATTKGNRAPRNMDTAALVSAS